MRARICPDDQEFEIDGFTFPAYGMSHVPLSTDPSIERLTPIENQRPVGAISQTIGFTRKKGCILNAIADKGTKRRLQRHVRGRKAGLGELNFLLWRQSRR